MCEGGIPAFTNSTSILPSFRETSANSLSTSVSLATSACTATTPFPISLPLRPGFSLRPEMATRAPSACRRLAVASPMPLFPPVIRGDGIGPSDGGEGGEPVPAVDFHVPQQERDDRRAHADDLLISRVVVADAAGRMVGDRLVPGRCQALEFLLNALRGGHGRRLSSRNRSHDVHPLGGAWRLLRTSAAPWIISPAVPARIQRRLGARVGCFRDAHLSGRRIRLKPPIGRGTLKPGKPNPGCGNAPPVRGPSP